ncbi:MAG: ribosome biogenesis GTPase Der [Pseudomonadota bacterium]
MSAAMTPRIAIVGRPNVGKSTLFNRMVGRRLALVDDQPGVTRDRREGAAQIGEADVIVIDTAGLEDVNDDSLEARMRRQTDRAVDEADIILFLFDARSGVTATDEAFADLLRARHSDVVLVANKSEGRMGEIAALDGFSLGLGEPVALSAEHGEGIGVLYAEILERIDAFDETDDEEAETGEGGLRVAVVGRPNVGKSTLINRLIGEDRLLTGPEAGITRDSIAVAFETGDRTLKLYDTAGMRRRAKVQNKVEKLSVSDTLRAIRFAEIVVLLIDAGQPFEKQDLQIADLIVREGRGLVIGINKWDLVPGPERPAEQGRIREAAERLLPQVRGLEIVPLSGLTGKGLDPLLQAIFATETRWTTRVPTAKLNRWFLDAVQRHPPPAVRGRRIKPRYMTQAKSRPPTFVLFASQGDALPEAYRRYVVNGLRETFALDGVPIRLLVRKPENPYADAASGRRGKTKTTASKRGVSKR